MVILFSLLYVKDAMCPVFAMVTTFHGLAHHVVLFVVMAGLF